MNYINTLVLLSITYLIVWLVGILFFFIAGSMLSNKIFKLINEKTRKDKKKILIQKLYKTILELSSIFFYLFFPLPIVLIILLTGGLIIGMDHFNVISSGSLGGLIAFAIILISAAIKSLIIKKNYLPEDFLLRRDKAPEIYQLCDNISEKLDIEPIDAIYLFHDASIGIFSEGKIINYFFGGIKKNLIIGIGALKNLPENQLKSVLAHELGHLHNYENFSGPFSLFVRQTIEHSLNVMKENRVDHIYNPTWLYIQLFKIIFFKISLGSSRFQELLADEIAVELYGAGTFTETLLNFTRNQIEFSIIKNSALMEALNRKQEPHNIYNLEIPLKWPEDVKYGCGKIFMTLKHEKIPEEYVNKLFQKETEAKTNSDNSHPSIKDRIARFVKYTNLRIYEKYSGTEFMIPDLISYQKYFSKMLYHNYTDEIEYFSEIDYQERIKKNS